METADFMYIIPPYRFTSYAIGIGAGYFLRKAKNLKISSIQLYLAWSITFTTLFVGFHFATELSAENYEYSRTHATFLTLMPIPFCAFFALIVFTAEMKFSSEFSFNFRIKTFLGNLSKNIFHYLDLLTNVLEWKGFKVTTRLSYNFYLVQFVVFYFNTGTARGSTFYNLTKTAVSLFNSNCLQALRPNFYFIFTRRLISMS